MDRMDVDTGAATAPGPRLDLDRIANNSEARHSYFASSPGAVLDPNFIERHFIFDELNGSIVRITAVYDDRTFQIGHLPGPGIPRRDPVLVTLRVVKGDGVDPEELLSTENAVLW